MGIRAEFQLLLSGHSCGAISRSGDYQYKGSGGREFDPGLEAGRWSRALAGNSSGPLPTLCLTILSAPASLGMLAACSGGVVFFF